MAWSALPFNQSDPESSEDAQDHPLARRQYIPAITAWVVHVVELTGFLCAIVLPFLYLPLLFVQSPEPARTVALAALIALHVVAIVVGAKYEPHVHEWAE